ncbi:MAG: hypothetical protein K1060chlam5_00901 [Candidatus Anoxychlamydiales bacterium]|nr:hypothetical protein [Candidatus Anoxychlamydiales bacterium]
MTQNIHNTTIPFAHSHNFLKSHQTIKIIAVALSCIAFFALQMGFSWAISVSIASVCCLTTLLSEKFLRTNHEKEINWFSISNIDKKKLLTTIKIKLLITPVFIGLLTVLGLNFPQTIISLICEKNLEILLLVNLIAPIVEEIFFRGFIQERIEDITTFIINPVFDSKIKFISTLATSIIFGFIHIIGSQVPTQIGKFFVFTSITSLGLTLGLSKNKDLSILSPISIHLANNIGITIGLLVFSNNRLHKL